MENFPRRCSRERCRFPQNIMDQGPGARQTDHKEMNGKADEMSDKGIANGYFEVEEMIAFRLPEERTLAAHGQDSEGHRKSLEGRGRTKKSQRRRRQEQKQFSCLGKMRGKSRFPASTPLTAEQLEQEVAK